MAETTIVNPLTGRRVRVGGAAYLKLARDGIVEPFGSRKGGARTMKTAGMKIGPSKKKAGAKLGEDCSGTFSFCTQLGAVCEGGKCVRRTSCNTFKRCFGNQHCENGKCMPEMGPTEPNPSTGGRHKRVRTGGRLMVDMEEDYVYRPSSYRRRKDERAVRRSMYSYNPTVVSGAKRSMKGKYLSRPSPSVSATLFSPGSTHRGNDGQMWFVKLTSRGVHRWVRL